jgi:hypothetical protein
MKEPTVEVVQTALLQLGALSFEMSRPARDVTDWALQHGKLKHAKAPYELCYTVLQHWVYNGAFAVSDGRFDTPVLKPFRFWVVSPAALGRRRQPALSAEQVELAAMRAKAGVAYSRIAADLGVSDGTVKKYLKQAGYLKGD